MESENKIYFEFRSLLYLESENIIFFSLVFRGLQNDMQNVCFTKLYIFVLLFIVLKKNDLQENVLNIQQHLFRSHSCNCMNCLCRDILQVCRKQNQYRMTFIYKVARDTLSRRMQLNTEDSWNKASKRSMCMNLGYITILYILLQNRYRHLCSLYDSINA